MKLNMLLLAGICMIAACNKRTYPEEQIALSAQEVYFDGMVDNEPMNLKIGADAYYCYASYQQNSEGIYLFKGELKKFDCNPCPLSLQVELSDYQARLLNAPVPVDSALRKGARSFIPEIPITQTLRFSAYSNKAISSVRWNTSDGSPSQDSVVRYEFGQPGPQTVSLTVRTTENCESMVVNTIYIGGAQGVLACSISGASLHNGLSRFTSAVIGGKPPYRYRWNFGDGEASSQKDTSHAYKWAGSYPVRLQVTDAEDHVCESNYIFVAGSDKSSCTANMQLSYAGNRNALLGGVRLQWTDRSNSVLRSDSVLQPAESYFEVVNSQAYAANERGEPGRLLTLRFNVLVANGDKKIWLKSDNTAIVVTYK